MDHFPKFFSAAVGKPIEVDNPFIWKTKADVVRSIVDHGCGELIKHTVSCTRVYDITRLHTHCGCCSQCLDRRFAILAANAAEHDPVEMYKVELLAGPRDSANDQTMAESYVRTALELREIGELAFFGRFSCDTARVLPCFPSLSADEVGRRVSTFTNDMLERLGTYSSPGLKVIVRNSSTEALPPSSLLMMTVLPGAAPALATIGKHADSVQAWIDEVEAEPASAGHGAPEPQQRRRGKSQPSLERARRAIKELYPDGVPGQATEPNASLCRQVSVKLKEAKLPNVSDDTILRAAGRRK